MQFILTVDTEADNQWRDGAPLTTANLASLPTFQALCDRFGFRPTYLCTHEVATSDEFDRLLLPARRDGRAEIGAHLHPWSTPPFDAQWDGPGRGRAYPCELPSALFTGKLEVLTAALQRRTGVAPTSYRAGRWGFSASQIAPLVDLGYLVDCSVTPLMEWSHDRGSRSGGPDFTTAPVAPYVLAYDDACRTGSSGLLEVPVTIVQTRATMRWLSMARAVYHRYRRSLPGRAADRLLRLAPEWFRPYPHMSAGRLIAVYRTACSLRLPAIEMMLHSSELMPGGSPANPDQAAVNRLHERLEATFTRLARDGVEAVTLSELARSWPGVSGTSAPAAPPGWTAAR